MTALPHTVVRTAHRLVPAWWVLAAWASLLLVVVAGLAAAAGLY
ncbi:molybdopterin oxidoreductase [Cellulomonas endophytica]|nr:molybdopterin oxidoreductase [Cellulomonas endophytica]